MNLRIHALFKSHADIIVLQWTVMTSFPCVDMNVMELYYMLISHSKYHSRPRTSKVCGMPTYFRDLSYARLFSLFRLVFLYLRALLNAETVTVHTDTAVWCGLHPCCTSLLFTCSAHLALIKLSSAHE